MIALATSVETPRKELQIETPKLYNLPPTPITFNANQQTTSTPNSSFQCHWTSSIPGPLPKGFVWKRRWELVPENLNVFSQEETAPPEPTLTKSFEELALKKIKGPTDKAPAPRRMKIDLTAKVIMQKEYLQAIKRAEEKKKKEQKRHSYRKKSLTTNAMISSTTKKLMNYLRVKRKVKMKLATLM